MNKKRTKKRWNPTSTSTRADVKRLRRNTLPFSAFCFWPPAMPAVLYSFWNRGVLVYFGRTEDFPRRYRQHRWARLTKSGKRFDEVRWMAVHPKALADVERAHIAFFLPRQNRNVPTYDESKAEVILRGYGYSVVKGRLAERYRLPGKRRFAPTLAGLRLIWAAVLEEDRKLLTRLARKGEVPLTKLRPSEHQMSRIAGNAVAQCRSATPVESKVRDGERVYFLEQRYRDQILRLAAAAQRWRPRRRRRARPLGEKHRALAPSNEPMVAEGKSGQPEASTAGEPGDKATSMPSQPETRQATDSSQPAGKSTAAGKE